MALGRSIAACMERTTRAANQVEDIVRLVLALRLTRQERQRRTCNARQRKKLRRRPSCLQPYCIHRQPRCGQIRGFLYEEGSPQFEVDGRWIQYFPGQYKLMHMLATARTGASGSPSQRPAASSSPCHHLIIIDVPVSVRVPRPSTSLFICIHRRGLLS